MQWLQSLNSRSAEFCLKSAQESKFVAPCCSIAAHCRHYWICRVLTWDFKSMVFECHTNSQNIGAKSFDLNRRSSKIMHFYWPFLFLKGPQDWLRLVYFLQLPPAGSHGSYQSEMSCRGLRDASRCCRCTIRSVSHKIAKLVWQGADYIEL